MAAPKKPTTPPNADMGDSAQSPANDSWLDASKLLERAQKEAAALLGRAKDNPKIAAGIAAGAAATIAGGAYAAKKMRSGAKTAKPKAPPAPKPAPPRPLPVVDAGPIRRR